MCAGGGEEAWWLLGPLLPQVTQLKHRRPELWWPWRLVTPTVLLAAWTHPQGHTGLLEAFGVRSCGLGVTGLPLGLGSVSTGWCHDFLSLPACSLRQPLSASSLLWHWLWLTLADLVFLSLGFYSLSLSLSQPCSLFLCSSLSSGLLSLGC
jgi:hypothetical protein